MRVTEILILVAVAPSAGFALLSRNPPDWVKLLAGIAGLLSAVQFLSSAYRWQMLPAYLLVAVCCLALLWPKIFKLGIPFGLAGFVLLASAAVLSTLLPVFDFPPLTGPFPVGTVTLHLIDSNRTELFSPDPSAKRELMIQIWYPAAGKGPRAFYLPRAAVDLKHAHLALVRTRAMTSVPVSSTESSYPVLIFCPSWNGGKAQNTFQTEELASHGFIVVGIDHPYGTNITVFPDGRRVYSKLYSWLDLSSDEALRESERAAEQQLAIRTADVHFVLTELERLNQHDPSGLMTGRLDVNRLGILGHSFGGAVAAEVCRRDARFRAGLNMDGMLFGEAADAGIQQPFFFMSDDIPLPPITDLRSQNGFKRRNAMLLNRDAERIRHSLTSYGGYEMTILGSSHANYSDSPLFCRMKRFTGAGPINIARAMQIINDYSTAFFEQHLKGIHQNLLDGPSLSYPEVRFQKWPGHQE